MPKTVLILDDDYFVRQSLCLFFEDHGWRVIPSASAEESFHLLKDEKPSCAIVDIRLPKMDGEHFIRQILKIYPNLMCIIYTASYDYIIPRELAERPHVYNHPFIKPFADLSEIHYAMNQFTTYFCKN